MNTPSNYTLDEIVRYTSIPDDVRALVDQACDRIRQLEHEVACLRKSEEILQEQVYFRNEYIEQVVDMVKNTTKHKELAKFIEVTLENSYIELSTQ